jgi:hypothetical protein
MCKYSTSSLVVKLMKDKNSSSVIVYLARLKEPEYVWELVRSYWYRYLNHCQIAERGLQQHWLKPFVLIQ